MSYEMDQRNVGDRFDGRHRGGGGYRLQRQGQIDQCRQQDVCSHRFRRQGPHLQARRQAVVNRAGKESKSDLKAGDAINVCYDKGFFTWTANYILVQEGTSKDCELIHGNVKGYDAAKKELTFTNEVKKDSTYTMGKAMVRFNMEDAEDRQRQDRRPCPYHRGHRRRQSDSAERDGRSRQVTVQGFGGPTSARRSPCGQAGDQPTAPGSDEGVCRRSRTENGTLESNVGTPTIRKVGRFAMTHAD